MIRWTIIVCAALHVDACNERVALETDSADASRLVVFHQTLCTSAARSFSVQARIQAILVDTGLVQRAVVVDPTLWPVALSVGVSPIALRTRAHWMVHSCSALSLWGTWVLHDARVDAVFIDASFVHGTFRVCCALWSWLNCKQGFEKSALKWQTVDGLQQARVKS